MPVANTSMKQVLPATPEPRHAGVLHAISNFIHDVQRTMFDTYHPERHYMRGPGPACAAKRADHPSNHH